MASARGVFGASHCRRIELQATAAAAPRPVGTRDSTEGALTAASFERRKLCDMINPNLSRPAPTLSAWHKRVALAKRSYSQPETATRSCLPVLKNGIALRGTSTLTPVRGLRRLRAERCLSPNDPKLRSSIRLPWAKAVTISKRRWPRSARRRGVEMRIELADPKDEF